MNIPFRKNLKISVIIPVYNEGDIINRTLSHLKQIKNRDNVEIIIVDGNNDKSTINRINDKDVIKINSPKGRAIQMNRGSGQSSGDVLLFLHADTILPDQAFDIIYDTMLKDIYAGGAFSLAFDNSRFPFRVISFGALLRCRFAKLPFGDQAIFIKKEYFNKIGKYKDIPLMEDFELMRRIKKTGGKIFISRKRVITSARKWERNGILKTTLTNWKIQALYLAGVSPERLAKIYYKNQ